MAKKKAKEYVGETEILKATNEDEGLKDVVETIEPITEHAGGFSVEQPIAMQESINDSEDAEDSYINEPDEKKEEEKQESTTEELITDIDTPPTSNIEESLEVLKDMRRYIVSNLSMPHDHSTFIDATYNSLKNFILHTDGGGVSFDNEVIFQFSRLVEKVQPYAQPFIIDRIKSAQEAVVNIFKNK